MPLREAADLADRKKPALNILHNVLPPPASPKFQRAEFRGGIWGIKNSRPLQGREPKRSRGTTRIPSTEGALRGLCPLEGTNIPCPGNGGRPAYLIPLNTGH